MKTKHCLNLFSVLIQSEIENRFSFNSIVWGGPQNFAGTLVNKDIEIGAKMPDNIIWLRV